MCQIRIFVKLGGKVGELDLKKRDLADLCEIQPGAAGEWVSGGIERMINERFGPDAAHKGA